MFIFVVITILTSLGAYVLGLVLASVAGLFGMLSQKYRGERGDWRRNYAAFVGVPLGQIDVSAPLAIISDQDWVEIRY